jgi:transposase-like protein
LSPATLRWLKQGWQDDLAPWQQRDLTGKRDVYVWGDGVSLETRLEEARHGMLVIRGADAKGQKELVGLWDGSRESEQSWTELLLDRKSRGLAQAPALAIGDGALGLWKALRHVYGQTR